MALLSINVSGLWGGVVEVIQGDILEVRHVNGVPVTGLCFTSNCQVRKDGKAVMGAGVARLFRDTFIGIDTVLGNRLMGDGDTSTEYLGEYTHGDRNLSIFAFPTKLNWRDKSDIGLIRESMISLGCIIDKCEYLSKGVILLPKPGVGLGGLDWNEVKGAIQDVVHDNVVIIERV